jgi:hypothetical protein
LPAGFGQLIGGYSCGAAFLDSFPRRRHTMTHHDQPVANQHRTVLDEEKDPTTRLDNEPISAETNPLAGVDPEKHPAPHNQPWRKIAEEVKQAAEKADGPLQ